MNQQSEYMTGYNNGWADAMREVREREKAAQRAGCLCCGEVREPAAQHTSGRYVCANCLVSADK